MMKYFFEFELGKMTKYFRAKKLAKSIMSFLFILVFLFLFLGIYQAFTLGFGYINTNIEQDVRMPITLFIYELFLLVLAGIIVFSCLISSVFSLFKAEHNNWIISSPKFKMFPKFIFVKSLAKSVWPFFVVFLPVILAFYAVYSLSVLSLFFIFLSFVVLLVMLNALTLSSIIIIGSVYYHIARRIKKLKFTFRGFVLILLSFVFIVGFQMWKVFVNIDLVKLFRADEAQVSVDVSSISSYFYFLPTHPFALEIINWQNNQLTEAMINFSVVTFLALASVFILWNLSFLFYPIWQKLQEGDSRKIALTKSFFANRGNFRFRGGTTAALFKKEALVLIRNPKGMLWFIFLFCIWLAQAGMNVMISSNIQRYQTDMSQKLAMFQSLQFIVAVYFICSFTLRFVFPAFSLEKKTAWILASAPVNFRRIYFGKYLFYSLFFVAIGILMNYINFSILNLSFYHAAYSMLLFILSVLFIVTLGLSMGAVFPNYETDDPEVISTSMPGLFFTALALIYGTLGAWTLYSSIVSNNMLNLIFFVGITFLLILIVLAKTPDIVGKKDFS